MMESKTSRRVLFLTRKFPPQKGGMESYSYNLVNNYAGEKKLIALRKKQIHLIWFFPWCLLYTIFSLRKYEIIQLGDMLLCGIGWIAKKIKPSIKIVATIHGLDITYQNKLYQFYVKKFSKGFDMYVPNSSYTNTIAKAYGYEPTTVIFPATLTENRFNKIEIDKKKFCKKYDIDENSIVMCTTGRLIRRKGVAWFIKNVIPLINDLNIFYLIVGTGNMKEEIEKEIQQSNSKKIKMLYWVSEEDLDNIYVHSDIFVMPNIYVENDVEGYGMVAIEAAAAGCIVVASKMQGIEDAVRDEINGILVEPENEKIFATSIRHIILNRDNFNKKIEMTKEYVAKECSGIAISKKYYNLFATLIR